MNQIKRINAALEQLHNRKEHLYSMNLITGKDISEQCYLCSELQKELLNIKKYMIFQRQYNLENDTLPDMPESVKVVRTITEDQIKKQKNYLVALEQKLEELLEEVELLTNKTLQL